VRPSALPVLTATVNRFNGVEVDPVALPEDPAIFARALQRSLGAWRRAGRRLVWLEVPIGRAALIPVATGAGFVFHHSHPHYLMLTCQLCADAPVPSPATHYIGAGGVVLNGAGELLVVVERYYRTPGQPPRYKLPGGALLEGEHLVEAVKREIREETGIRTQFEALVCFRHWHEYRHGKSDIYFVARLRALTRRIRRQQEEIAECRWMPLDEYLAAPQVSPFNRGAVRAALDSAGLGTVHVAGYEDRGRYEVFMPPTDAVA
jgi:8-oxo-dGTP pyrophosphatase MutT (NUDIX family)